MNDWQLLRMAQEEANRQARERDTRDRMDRVRQNFGGSGPGCCVILLAGLLLAALLALA